MKSPPKRTVIALALGLAVAAAGVLTAAARAHAHRWGHHSDHHGVVDSDGETRRAPTGPRAPAAPGYIFEIQESPDPAVPPAPGPRPPDASAVATTLAAGTAMAWPVADGGNGHFYQAVCAPDGINWADAQAWAVAQGGYLATLGSAAENDFVFKLIDDPKFWWNNAGNSSGPWLGGWQPAGSPEPDDGWQWLNREGAFAYTNWAANEPDDNGAGQDRLNFYGWGPDNRQPTLDDEAGTLPMHGFVVEYDSPPVLVSGLARRGLRPASGSGPEAATGSLPTAQPAAPRAVSATPGAVAGPVAPIPVTGELSIISAIFSGHGGQADVTALV